MTMLDASKVGYRWKGKYNSDSMYISGDTVFRNGEIQFWDGNDWRTMATGQMDTKVKGEIAGYNKLPVTNEYFSGAPGQKFVVDAFGKPRWQYDDISRTNSVVALPTPKRGTGYYVDGGFAQGMFTIMSDGTLMSWGRNYNESLGQGNQGDIGRSQPAQVQFYQDADPIVKVFGCAYQAFALTSSGQLFAWGENGDGQLGVGNTTNQQRPILVNGQGDLPLNAEVTDVYTVKSYYGYVSTMIMTSDGLAYGCGNNRYHHLGFADGTGTGDQTTPKLIAKTAEVGCKKIFNGSQYYAASAFLGEDNRLYTIGQATSSLSVFNSDPDALSTHKLWGPSDDSGVTVKDVIWHESDDHSQDGSQYHRCGAVLSEEGDIWTYQTSVRRYNITHPNNLHINEWRPDPRISGIQDLGIGHGGYESIVAMKKNGEIWTLGSDQYEIRGLDNDGNNIGANNEWQRNYSAPEDNVKLSFGCSRYGYMWSSLTKGGYVFGSGSNERGHQGHGWAGQFGNSTNAIGTSWTNNTELNRRTIARVPDRIIDFYSSGYVQNATSDITQYYLTDKGELWSAGAGNYGRLGWEDDNENGYSPQRVRF